MSVGALPKPRHRVYAAIYDRIMATGGAELPPLRDATAGAARGRVIEIGCGTGHNLLHYDWLNVEALAATEPDPFMLSRATARLAGLDSTKRGKTTLYDAPAEALPFPDASFDSAIATLVLCTVAEPDRALAEIWRVLRPGGQLRLLEHVKGTGRTASVQRIVQPLYGWMSGGCQLSRETEDAVRRHGFALEVSERTQALGALWPAFVGVATKPNA